MERTEDATEGSAPPPEITRASLCAGGWETVYARAGAGRPVLLLGDPADALTTRLVALLASTRRVLAPEPPVSAEPEPSADPGPRPPAFSRWLCDFLDGVGIGEAPLVVSDPRLATAAMAFSTSHPCRVTRLVLLFEEGALDESGGRALADEVGALLSAERP